ncbi:MucR family transcriptional regulator [Serratia ficaria]|uniref:MucR family transcriptional regulator n=1 Tax=Serratia ficaria TaxID=61651 RepID=UPI00077CBDCF|nr:MucR family transcriptional regulator [Serratia ficaria]
MAGRINSRAEAEAYVAGDLVECLECGKKFAFLPVHIKRMHGLNAEEYRERYNIPAGIPLAGKAYREMQRQKLVAMQKDGILDYSHLPKAEKAARRAGRGDKRDFDRQSQSHIMKLVNESGRAYRKTKSLFTPTAADNSIARVGPSYEQIEFIKNNAHKMSASEMQRELGISRKVIKRRADKLGLSLLKGKPPVSKPTLDWGSVDWSKSNKEIAASLGASYSAVKAMRRRLGVGPGKRAPMSNKGVKRNYSPEHLALIKKNAEKMRLAALSSSKISRTEHNIHAKKWTLVSPDGEVYRVVNLHNFIRENTELFNPEDVVWKLNGEEAEEGSRLWCRASQGIRSIKQRSVESWKGWKLLNPEDDEP